MMEKMWNAFNVPIIVKSVLIKNNVLHVSMTIQQTEKITQIVIVN